MMSRLEIGLFSALSHFLAHIALGRKKDSFYVNIRNPNGIPYPKTYLKKKWFQHPIYPHIISLHDPYIPPLKDP